MLDTVMNVTYEAGYLMPFFLILNHKRGQVFGFRCYVQVLGLWPIAQRLKFYLV